MTQQYSFLLTKKQKCLTQLSRLLELNRFCKYVWEYTFWDSSIKLEHYIFGEDGSKAFISDMQRSKLTPYTKDWWETANLVKSFSLNMFFLSWHPLLGMHLLFIFLNTYYIYDSKVASGDFFHFHFSSGFESSHLSFFVAAAGDCLSYVLTVCCHCFS